jgi:hypothetical protein
VRLLTEEVNKLMRKLLERWQQLYRRYASFVKPFNERKKPKPISKHAPFLQLEHVIEFGFYCLQAWLSPRVERFMTRLAARLGVSDQTK